MKNKIVWIEIRWLIPILVLVAGITIFFIFNQHYEDVSYAHAQTTYTGNSVSGTASFTAGQDTTTNLTVVEDTKTILREVGDIYIDLQKATTGFDAVHTTGDILSIRLWVKIDGTNYRQISVNTYTDNSITNHVFLRGFVTDKPFKVSAAVDNDRGAYDLIYRYCYFTK